MTQQLRPRTAVLAEIWSTLKIDADVFTNKAGAPLARALKCLLEPLVIRPRLNPDLAKPVIAEPAAERLRELMHQAAEPIENAASWYRILRAERRKLGITDGNPQELYFPRAYELAIQHQRPGPFAEQICRDVLAEIHFDGGNRRAQLTDALNDPGMQTRCLQELCAYWQAQADLPAADLQFAELAASIREILGGAVDLHAVNLAWQRALERNAAGELGRAICRRSGVLRGYLETATSAPADVAVASSDPVAAPPLQDQVPGALILDRSLASRAKAALRRGSPAASIADLLDREAARSAQPWGLAATDLQLTLLAGLHIAASVQVIGQPVTGPSLATQIQARIRKEGYVLHLRRLWCDGKPIHPRQQQVVNDLVAFWRPYLRRLWARLHGRDVTGELELEAVQARELLAGVAKSVTLDHRKQIRDALERRAG